MSTHHIESLGQGLLTSSADKYSQRCVFTTKQLKTYIEYKVVNELLKSIMANNVNLICQLCDKTFTKLKYLKRHIKDAQFLQWKMEEEENTISSFVKYSAPKQLKEGKKSFYVCHRSGLFKSKSSGTRVLKSQGSSKMNSTCPAYMTVTEMDDGMVHVLYYPTHHEKLKAGESVTKILDDLHIEAARGEKKRIHYVTRKDVKNIQQSLKLQETEEMIKMKKSEQTVQPHTVSVQFWVNQLQENGKAILIVKPEGKLIDKIKEIHMHHKKSLLIQDDHITCVKHEKVIGKCMCGINATFVVKAPWGPNTYIVQPSLAKCIQNCQLTCKFCKICSHEYKCTCPGYQTFCNICEHIHAVCRKRPKNSLHSKHATRSVVEYKTEALNKLKSLLSEAEKAYLSDDVWREITKATNSLIDCISKKDLKTNLNRVAQEQNESLGKKQHSITGSNLKKKRKAFDCNLLGPVNKRQNCDTNKNKTESHEFVPEVSLNITQVDRIPTTEFRKKQIMFDWERTKSLPHEEKIVVKKPKPKETLQKRKPIIFDWERDKSLNEEKQSVEETNLNTEPKVILVEKEEIANNSTKALVAMSENPENDALIVHTGFDHEYCK
ncbi:hypothetical protein C0J52_13262 [Blattella germanica]|nr:hypothetical protein C0J52_13262 [Blattella germanica]